MRTRTKIGLAVIGTAGALATATGLAFGGHPGSRERLLTRLASAVIEDALDAAGGVTPEQRTAVHAARDRVLAALARHHQQRNDRREELLRLFQAEPLDGARLAALRQTIEAEHRAVADAIAQAFADVHQALTPVQRKAVADYVRQHRGRHHSHWGGGGHGHGW
jgi:hypothetical protein